METVVRQYNHADDYERVGRFLERTFRTTGGHVNWVQPRWEYMHYHPAIWEVDLGSIGVWEAEGRIVGVVHPEHGMGTAFFQIDPEYGQLKEEMLRYAEKHLSIPCDGGRRLRLFITEGDDEFQEMAAEMGYEKDGGPEPMLHLDIPNPFPQISVPAGFRLKTLAEDNDLRKLDRVITRGFNHHYEPSKDGIRCREFMQSAPDCRMDLNIVVEAPDGNFASYCGMWYEPANRLAYVEPVATDPDYRRRGLGRAAVLEGIRRCGELGARVACVISGLEFYLSMGFRQVYADSAWRREWSLETG